MSTSLTPHRARPGRRRVVRWGLALVAVVMLVASSAGVVTLTRARMLDYFETPTTVVQAPPEGAAWGGTQIAMVRFERLQQVPDSDGGMSAPPPGMTFVLVVLRHTVLDADALSTCELSLGAGEQRWELTVGDLDRSRAIHSPLVPENATCSPLGDVGPGDSVEFGQVFVVPQEAATRVRPVVVVTPSDARAGTRELWF